MGGASIEGKVLAIKEELVKIHLNIDENQSEDETGVTLISPTGLNLNAGGEIVIRTRNSINISAQSQILITKGNTENGVSIECEFHIKGNNVIKNGSCRETYAPFAEGGV
ncbi:hypothetical protein FDB28_09125 [Clostridium botulinum]|uniref:hypothetical protein n=1 Tax=Clostridium sp. ZBS13 TaxID=2949971 RepID=UPI0013F95354|nr:hypothetical protein [Clostridium sp. ZBS13]NFN94253.1 hypothetical protein [Clostridium botulinum]NFS97729.1 hypothetical protein [Clostridium botulinum]